jgi:hypothetical protein
MAYGYFTDVAEAQTYFTSERLETDAWDDVPAAKKEPLLVQAYNRLYYSKEFILPTLAEADVDELPVLQKAQAEMAYYLAMHLADEDRRKGLQAQAIIEAGVVKEKYDSAKLYDTPIPSFIRDLLCSYSSAIEPKPFGAVDIQRDENESVSTKIDDYHDL